MGLEKRQWIEETRGAVVLSVIARILEKIEVVSEILGKEPGEIEVEEWVFDVDALATRISAGMVEVRVRAPSELVEEAGAEDVLEVNGHRVVLRIIGDPELWGASSGSLYDMVPRMILRMDGSRFKNLAFGTSRDGIEYMGIYLEDGRVAFFEGEHYRVSLPFVRALANIHTHPEGACSLSIPDIRSGLDLLVEGGLFEAAVTPSCAAVMYRIGLVIEDDYVALKEFLLNSQKRRKPVMMPRLKSVRFARLAY